MKRKVLNTVAFLLLIALAAAFIFPVAVVVINSFKSKFSIAASPFTIPMGAEFAGFSNYTTGIENNRLPRGFGLVAVYNRRLNRAYHCLHLYVRVVYSAGKGCVFIAVLLCARVFNDSAVSNGNVHNVENRECVKP